MLFPPDPSCSSAAPTLATVAAIVYGVTQEGSLGTVGLIFAAVVPRRCSPASTSTSATADVSAMDTAARPRSRRPPRPPPGPACGRWSRALGGVLVVVGLVTYPPVFIFGIIALLAATVEWMVAGLERAGLGRPRRTTPRCAAASPTRWSSRSSPPSGSPSSSTRSAGSCCSSPRRAARPSSPSSPRSCWSSASSSPSGRRSATAPIAVVCVDRRPRPGRRRRQPRRSAGEREMHPHETTARSPPRASATRPPRPRPTSTRRRPSRPRPTSPPS